MKEIPHVVFDESACEHRKKEDESEELPRKVTRLSMKDKTAVKQQKKQRTKTIISKVITYGWSDFEPEDDAQGKQTLVTDPQRDYPSANKQPENTNQSELISVQFQVSKAN